jgi:hypothetical protein
MPYAPTIEEEEEEEEQQQQQQKGYKYANKIKEKLIIS